MLVHQKQTLRQGRTTLAPRPGLGNPQRYPAYCKDSGAPQESTESRECLTGPNTYRKDRACPVPLQLVCTQLPNSELPVQLKTRNPSTYGTLLHPGKAQATGAQGQHRKGAGIPGTNRHKGRLKRPCTIDNALGQA